MNVACYENFSAAEKEFMGPQEVERIEKKKENIKEYRKQESKNAQEEF